MRIGEVCKRTGLSKKTVQHYVGEGLVTPASESNGYLDFSDEDAATLLAIRRLRELDLPLQTIRAMLMTPQSAHYHIAAHRRRLHEEQWLVGRRIQATEDLLTRLTGEVTGKSLGAAIADAIPDDLIPTGSDGQITWEDADTLALFLIGHFVDATDLSMFQQFLCDRLRQAIISSQDEATLHLRNVLRDLPPGRLSAFGFAPQRAYEQVGFSTVEDCRSHLSEMVQTLERGLRNPRLRRLCSENGELNAACLAFLENREVCSILEGLSPYFAAVWKSYGVMRAVLEEHLETTGGQQLATNAGKLLGESVATASELALLYPLFAEELAR